MLQLSKVQDAFSGRLNKIEYLPNNLASWKIEFIRYFNHHIVSTVHSVYDDTLRNPFVYSLKFQIIGFPIYVILEGTGQWEQGSKVKYRRTKKIWR